MLLYAPYGMSCSLYTCVVQKRPEYAVIALMSQIHLLHIKPVSIRIRVIQFPLQHPIIERKEVYLLLCNACHVMFVFIAFQAKVAMASRSTRQRYTDGSRRCSI